MDVQFPNLPTVAFLEESWAAVNGAITDPALAPADAAAMARACVDRAEDIINSTPYHSVSRDMRELHESSSILYATALMKLPPKSCKHLTHHDSLTDALRVLDRTLLISGCPKNRSRVHEMVAEIITSLGPDPKCEDEQMLSCAVPDMVVLSHELRPAKSAPSLIEFAAHIASESSGPILLRSDVSSPIAHWPALSTRPWSDLRHLRRLLGRRLVPIEIGSRYTDATWSQSLMTFNEFLDRFVLRTSMGEISADHDEPEVGYLAQHDLFRQIPELFSDVAVPEYCFAAGMDDDGDEDNAELDGEMAEVSPSAWFGPKGTISPLHTDPRKNMFAQVVGYKYVRLYSPDETANLYPFGSDSTSENEQRDDQNTKHLLGNTSSVDVENPDIESFPRFADARYVECIVGPGDLLYIPKGWWHYVRSLSTSFSVSFWFGSKD